MVGPGGLARPGRLLFRVAVHRPLHDNVAVRGDHGRV